MLQSDATVDGPLSLSLPWWAFLGARESIKQTMQRTQTTLMSTEPARLELANARDRERLYESEAAHDIHVEEKLLASGFMRPLSTDQARNVRKLVARNAAATFSVPGAGKTTEALAFYFIKANRDENLVVIAPKIALAAWEEQ